ncbi:MAG: outer membrane beta-barrel family protein [Paludibacteraceae bacterium]|nr:outer membrane beta-barrel family protein [Paludibacteraceae bacterium]
MRRIISTFVFFLLACVGANAQYMVEIKPSKKVIHVDQTGLSDNTGVKDVLQAMPELLNRYTDNFFDNFSIQVDGKDAGSSRDVVLTQTKLAEVDVIEISTSPTVSEQKNGEGGVINIKLKPVAREGVSGEVLLDGTTEWDVQPSLLLNYKKNKFTLRSSFMMEYWNPTNYKEKYWSNTDETVARLDTLKTRFCQETAKLHLEWNPTSQDEVKVYVWETYAHARQTANAGEQTMVRIEDDTKRILWQETNMCEQVSDRQWKLVAEGNVSYKHVYARGGELNIEGDYSFNPNGNKRHWRRMNLESKDMIYTGQDSLTDNLTYDHQVRGEISTKHLLLPFTSSHYLDLKSGVNTTYSFGRTRTITDIEDTHFPPDTNKVKGNKLYVSPYLEMNYRYHGWELQVGARYQYYRHGQQENEQSIYYTHNHTWLGNASVLWQVKEHHLLRLMVSRDVIWAMMKDRDGKIDPRSNPYYMADLNYIYDWNNKVDYVMTNFGIKYVYAKRDALDIGVLSANAQLIYRHGIFAMAFAGNVYAKKEIYINKQDNNWRFYANVSITPVLSFRKNWTLSAKLLYNSQMFLAGETYGDCFYTQLRLSKDWNKWNVHIEINDIFDYITYNTYQTDRGTEKELVDMYPRCVAIGASYKF